MGKISRALADIDRSHRRWAAAETRWLPNERDQLRHIAHNAKLDRMLAEQGALLRQIYSLKARVAAQEAKNLSAGSERAELAQLERQHEVLDRAIKRRMGGPPPWEGMWEGFGSQMKTELGIAGHQALLLIGIGVGYALLALFLAWALPHVWDWFWSFP